VEEIRRKNCIMDKGKGADKIERCMCSNPERIDR
jgi:hypothetical protein